ncbi:hypothetical protein [Microtetraspora malaysiensis]|uniref:hypothetical protein n=1 Tax=Microtetraspora malaysiensis TaxID=161358 RepID=UPI003D89B313
MAETPTTDTATSADAAETPALTAASAHARARAYGPLTLRLTEPAPPGFIRLTLGDAVTTAQTAAQTAAQTTAPPATGDAARATSGPPTSPVIALPAWPDGATPSILDEYGAAPVPVERSGEHPPGLRACWSDLSAEPWPGVPASVADVLACYRALIGRGDDMTRSRAVGALRRLADTGWIIRSGDVVRLGPRCATWPPESHSVLRELVRRLPGPQAAEGPVTLPWTRPPRPTGPLRLRCPKRPPRPPGRRTRATAGRQPRRSGRGRGRRAGRDRLGSRRAALPYDERRRAELVAAFMAVDHAAEPVHEARFAALRDPALRRTLAEMLARRGRTLIQRRDTWTSGYDDDVTARMASAPGADTGRRPGLSEGERAVLTLVLVHSVAIPRADGLLSEDTWLSPYPVAVEELRRRTLLPIGELESALRTLRQAGLLTQVKAVSEETPGGYVPGPQFHRLTAAARRRLQEELILAAGPQTPLATAIRARRA